MLEVLRYSVPLYFTIPFMVMFVVVNIVCFYNKSKNDSKNFRIMIDFFGKGFHHRQISKEELTRISSFCEEVLVNKYHFVKVPIIIGANNEYDIMTFYKEFKQYNANKAIESLKIQLVPSSNGCSMNVMSIGSKRIIKYFILFYNYTSAVFKESKISVNTGYDSIIKVIDIPSYKTDFEIEPQYIKTCNGYVETFRSNCVIKQKNSSDPIITPIVFSLGKESVKEEVQVETQKDEPIIQGKNTRGGMKFSPGEEEPRFLADLNNQNGDNK